MTMAARRQCPSMTVADQLFFFVNYHNYCDYANLESCSKHTVYRDIFEGAKFHENYTDMSAVVF